MGMRIFEVPGKAVGKGRPRASAHNGHVAMYTPKGTKNYEQLVQKYYREKYSNMDPLLGPLEACISVFVTPPKSASKKVKAEMLAEGYPCKKPDLDNVAKVVLDALNGIAYVDDAQIAKLNVVRRYTELDDRVMVGVGEIWDGSEE